MRVILKFPANKVEDEGFGFFSGLFVWAVGVFLIIIVLGALFTDAKNLPELYEMFFG